MPPSEGWMRLCQTSVLRVHALRMEVVLGSWIDDFNWQLCARVHIPAPSRGENKAGSALY
jgi:hypothetical protein